MVKRIFNFFDKLEDHVRIKLSHTPILYALIGAVGIILLWKGVWDLADLVPALQGWGSIIVGTTILLMSGLLVSFFIGDSIIISGFKREKKLTEKTEAEVKAERAVVEQVISKLDHLEQDLHELKAEKRS